MAYTIEQIGARARLRNPQAFKNFDDAQIGRILVQRNPKLQQLLQITEQTEKKPGRFSEFIEDIKQTGSNIKSRFQGASESMRESSSAFEQGQQGVGRTFLQQVGQGAGAVSQSIGDVFTGAGKAILPQSAEESIESAFQSGAKKVAEIPIIREGIIKAMNTYEDIKKNDPAKARDLEALFDTSMFGLDVLGLKGTQIGLKYTKNQISEISKNIARGLDDVVVDVRQGLKQGIKVSPSVNLDNNEYIKSRLTKLLGIFSGENTIVIENAFKNPQLANQAIQNGDDAIRKAITEAAENSIKIRTNFIQGYSNAKKSILGKYSKALIPRNNLIGEFNNVLKKYNVKILKDGSLDFTTSKIIANPGEISKITDAYSALRNWETKLSIDSLDEFKQLVGSLSKFPREAGGTSKSTVLGTLYNRINEIIDNRLPKNIAREYRGASDIFSNNISWYNDVVDAFNSGDPFTRIVGALGKNKDTLRKLLEFYETHGGTDILPLVAGRELGLDKQAAFGFLNPRSWIDFFISPKKQGEIITNIGSKIKMQ